MKNILKKNENNEINKLEENINDVLISNEFKSSIWSLGGKQRENIIQVLLNLCNNFGVYHTNEINNEENNKNENEINENNEKFQEIFYKSAYAVENVNGLRKYVFLSFLFFSFLSNSLTLLLFNFLLILN